MSFSNRWRVGFDIGGTFTDFVLYDAAMIVFDVAARRRLR